jgi:hypothetical protein
MQLIPKIMKTVPEPEPEPRFRLRLRFRQKLGTETVRHYYEDTAGHIMHISTSSSIAGVAKKSE